MTEYAQRQITLKTQASQILNDLNIIKFLSKFGKVETVGSYYLDLMSWRDVDLLVIQEPNYEDYLETVSYLFNKKEVYNLTLQDYRKSVHPDRPQGLYLGIKYLFDKTKGWAEMWKIDIWFLPTTQLFSVEKRDYVKSKLNKDNTETILRIKNEMRENTQHGKEISGAEVYSAVLDHEVKDLEGFRTYLKEQDREL